jgi:hypothetical protein
VAHLRWQGIGARIARRGWGRPPVQPRTTPRRLPPCPRGAVGAVSPNAARALEHAPPGLGKGLRPGARGVAVFAAAKRRAITSTSTAFGPELTFTRTSTSRGDAGLGAEGS